MKDFSFWYEYEGNSEGSGRSEKIWLKNPDTGKIGLFKFKKDEHTTDHVSECLAYQLACAIGLPCAKFELGVYGGREGSISYSIIENDNQILIEGISFINSIYPNYNQDLIKDMESGDMYSLEMIKRALDKYGLFEQFLRIPIFDYLIGNTDRHQSNWAILKDGEKQEISPLYDNSSSLCAYVPDKKVLGYLGNDKMRWDSLVEKKSRSTIRRTASEKRAPTHLEVLIYIKENYYYETKDFVKKILRVMTKRKICDILCGYSENELLKEKKQLIEKFLLYKLQVLNDTYFGKEE